MSKLESVAPATFLRTQRNRVLSLIAILGSTLLAASCPDRSEDVDVPGPPEPVYFLVAELPGQEVHNDSYVLPLTRADHIAHARDIIARGHEATGRYIVVANMLAGADGINRNLRAPDAPEWSWHVSSAIGFADATMEILDGWPGFVEKDVAGWIENTDLDGETGTEGTLGFWTYTVVEELEGYPDSLP